jgi:hypothetical protein
VSALSLMPSSVSEGKLGHTDGFMFKLSLYQKVNSSL